MMKITSTQKGLYRFENTRVNLLGCIAIDNNNISLPAIGGTRLANYSSTQEMLDDAIRLALAMTKKCIVADLPFIGGKGVLLKSPQPVNLQAYLEAYAEVIETFKGEFITGCDVGISNEDMLIVNSKTQYITGLSKNSNCDYLSYLTALGVYIAIESTITGLNPNDVIEGKHVLIQGVGKVGKALARILIENKVRVTICDIDQAASSILAKELGCNIVEVNDLFNVSCDVFAPCAMGGIINQNNFTSVKASIICGAANNPLHDLSLLKKLDEKNIMFVPEWISNIGGTIYAAKSYLSKDLNSIIKQVKDTLQSRTFDFIRLKLKNDLYYAWNKFLPSIITNFNYSSQILRSGVN